jgi:hypothetical protein
MNQIRQFTRQTGIPSLKYKKKIKLLSHVKRFNSQNHKEKNEKKTSEPPPHDENYVRAISASVINQMKYLNSYEVKGYSILQITSVIIVVGGFIIYLYGDKIKGKQKKKLNSKYLEQEKELI